MDGFKKAPDASQLEQAEPENSGKAIMLTMDCKSCHKEVGKSIGPSFMDVSTKYKKDPNAMAKLTDKVIKGGSGVWGETAMSAHPTIKKSDVDQIITWVLSLDNKDAQKKSLPPSGTIMPDPGKQPASTLVLSAKYTDDGGEGIKALTGHGVATLNSNNYLFSGAEKVNGFTMFKFNGINLAIMPQNGGWFELDNIDLTGVRSVNMTNFWQAPPSISINFEVRMDTPDGKLIGNGSMPVPAKDQKSGITHLVINPVTDGKLHKLYFIYKPVKPVAMVAGVTGLQFSAK
jgi:cytochrome c551/c552